MKKSISILLAFSLLVLVSLPSYVLADEFIFPYDNLTVNIYSEDPVAIENPALFINEICSSNATGIKDQFGKNSDWIEIYNASDGYANLAGYGLSDDNSIPMKYVFPKAFIPPHGFLVVFTASNNSAGPNDIYGNFGISKSGETIFLCKPDGITNQDKLKAPALIDDTTYGRIPDGGTLKGILLSSSPGQSNNNTQFQTIVSPPIFSVYSGFYASEISLNLSANPGLKIYYTTDGSDPDPSTVNQSTSTTYTVDHNQFTRHNIGTNLFSIQPTKSFAENILIRNRVNDDNTLSMISKGCMLKDAFVPSVKIDKCMVVRAVTEDANGNLSNIITQSYFIGPQYSDLQTKYNGVPIISIVTDPRNLYDYDKGIFNLGTKYFDYYLKNGGDPSDTGKNVVSNYTMHGSEWERPAHIDYFEGNGALGFSQDVGIRTHGALSRHFPQKSLSINSRIEYGKTKINYEMLPNLIANQNDPFTINSFDSILLRNGGNHAEEVKFQDPFIQSLVADRDTVATQGYRPVVVFIDGEYWGAYCLQEDFSRDYIQSHYGVNADNVILSDDEVIAPEDNNNVMTMIANSDVRNDADYKAVCEKLDINSLIDYLFVETYIGNADWPQNNVAAWWSKTKTTLPYEDGKYRYLLYDTDQSLTEASVDKFTDTGLNTSVPFGWNPPSVNSGPGLLANADFRKKFIVTSMDLINVNFRPEYVNQKLDEINSEFRPLMTDYYNRFGINSMSDYDYYLNLRKQFFINRPNYYIGFLKTDFHLSNAVDLTINTNDSNMGTIKVNTVTPTFVNNTWSGKYFTDYPISLKAMPKSGYKFVGWQTTDGGTISNSESDTITVNFSKAITLTATFKTVQETGTANDPYLIEKNSDLNWMAEMLETYYNDYFNKYYVLTNDIVLDDTVENNFKAIGTEKWPFDGNFDGRYHTIKGININSVVQGQGLFGTIGSNGTVKNIGVLDINITSQSLSGKNIGGIAGKNYGLIENCYCVGGTLKGDSTVGGIAGSNTGPMIVNGGIIRNCFNTSDIICLTEATKGGITGKTEFNASVVNCYSLIKPVPTVSDGGTVDLKTKIVTTTEFIDGSVVSLLNKECGIWMQGENNPEFGTIRIDGNNVTILSDTELTEVKLIIASYKDNQLTGIKTYTVNVTANTPLIQSIPIELKSGDKIKAMLWTDIDNSIKPTMFYTIY